MSRKTERRKSHSKAEDIADSYQGKLALYASFSERLAQLLAQLLEKHRIRSHSITHRAKSIESLARKIKTKPATYRNLDALTDLAGVRITTYLADDVDKVAALIESEFAIDKTNSPDKRAALDPDRFGYLSLHFVVSFGSSRAALPEYASFAGLKAEIQIRSILQHAWAEIEHDLGYKSALEIPRHIRRQFARLAGLLELADSEFVAIRDAIDRYATSVSNQLNRSPDRVNLDRISLVKFYNRSDALRGLEKELADTLLGTNTAQVVYDEDIIASNVNRLEYVGFTSIAQVRKYLRQYRPVLLDLARHVANARQFLYGPKKERLDGVFSGIAFLYLCNAISSAGVSEHETKTYFRTIFPTGGDDTAKTYIEWGESQKSIPRPTNSEDSR